MCFSFSEAVSTCLGSVHADEADAVVSTEAFLLVASSGFCFEDRILNFADFKKSLVEGKEACIIASGDLGPVPG